MTDQMEGQPMEDLIETPKASTIVENIVPADYWATLPDIERKRLQNIYGRCLAMQQRGEHFN